MRRGKSEYCILQHNSAIQLPFNVPNEKFRIGSYVKGLLKDINYKKSDEFEVGYLENIVKSTIGENPRSIKRLVNSLSLYQIIDRNEGQEKPKSVEEQYLRFGLSCLQISDRNIYDTLQRNSDFLSWDDVRSILERKMVLTKGWTFVL